MLTLHHTIAKVVAQKMPTSSARYDQIWAIKQELIKADLDILSTDRETIDDVLDILFDKYAFQG
jgi:hypothetical protein